MSSPPAVFPAIVPGASLLVAYQVKGKRVLLVGGGAVAAGRLSALLAAGALVTLISPSSGLSPEVAQRIFVDNALAAYHDRPFADEDDLAGFDMVLTAIDDAVLSEAICQMCRSRRIVVNVADVPPSCDFYFGSIVRRGPLQIMVSTNGKGPRIANRVRRAIESALPDGVGDAIESVGRLRGALRKRVPGMDTGTIERRMGWMIKVCDRWSLSELAEMDDAMLEAVLDGWEDDVAKGYWDVRPGVWGKVVSTLGIGRCPVAESPDGRATRCPFLLGSTGFLLGLVTAGVVVAARWHSTRI